MREKVRRTAAKAITDDFPVSDAEYAELEGGFANLCRYAAWQLIKKNAKNNHTDDFDDVNQDLVSHLVIAGSYYKRQIYIERCLIACLEYAGGADILRSLAEDSGSFLGQAAAQALDGVKNSDSSDFLLFVLRELACLWHDRKRHGAGRQKFGPFQERLLERITRKLLPQAARPNKRRRLEIDHWFVTYCKFIIWNAQKSIGRKITKEKCIRTGMISLSEYDYLATQGKLTSDD